MPEAHCPKAKLYSWTLAWVRASLTPRTSVCYLDLPRCRLRLPSLCAWAHSRADECSQSTSLLSCWFALRKQSLAVNVLDHILSSRDAEARGTRQGIVHLSTSFGHAGTEIREFECRLGKGKMKLSSCIYSSAASSPVVFGLLCV